MSCEYPNTHPKSRPTPNWCLTRWHRSQRMSVLSKEERDNGAWLPKKGNHVSLHYCFRPDSNLSCSYCPRKAKLSCPDGDWKGRRHQGARVIQHNGARGAENAAINKHFDPVGLMRVHQGNFGNCPANRAIKFVLSVERAWKSVFWQKELVCVYSCTVHAIILVYMRVGYTLTIYENLYLLRPKHQKMGKAVIDLFLRLNGAQHIFPVSAIWVGPFITLWLAGSAIIRGVRPSSGRIYAWPPKLNEVISNFLWLPLFICLLHWIYDKDRI